MERVGSQELASSLCFHTNNVMNFSLSLTSLMSLGLLSEE